MFDEIKPFIIIIYADYFICHRDFLRGCYPVAIPIFVYQIKLILEVEPFGHGNDFLIVYHEREDMYSLSVWNSL
jgi:hypothetical protein